MSTLGATQSKTQSFITSMGKKLHDFVKGSAPSERNIYSAYALLVNEQGEDVGSFVLGLYQLAKAPGGLRVQQFEQEFIAEQKAIDDNYVYNPRDLLNDQYAGLLNRLLDKYYPKDERPDMERDLQKIYKSLYHADNTARSPFEMALIRSHKRMVIQDAIRKEYEWQQSHGLLPQEVFRLRMEEWLGRIGEKGLQLKQNVPGSALKGVTITLDNPKPKTNEELVHYLMMWVATLTTLSSVILTISALTSFPLGLLAGLATWFAFESANNFATFDMGEFFWKDVRWSTTKNFLNTRKFSPKQAFQSVVFLAAMGFIAFTGAQALFAATLSFPLFSTMMPTLATQALAFTAAAWSFATTMIGLSIPLRFLRGFSFHDNQVNPKEIPDDLPPIEASNDVSRPAQKLRALKELVAHRYGQEVVFNPITEPTVNTILLRDLTGGSDRSLAQTQAQETERYHLKF